MVIEVMFGKGRGNAHSTNEINSTKLRKHIYGHHFAKIASMMIDLSGYNCV